jgi:hypothetical protein
MKKYSFVIIIIAAMLLPVLPVFAEIISNPVAGITMDVPDRWKVKKSGTDIELTSPDQLITMLFAPLETDGMKDALDQVDKELRKVITNISEGKPKTGNINGMPTVEIDGTGKIGENNVNWGVHVIMAKKPIMIISMRFPGWEKWEKTLNSLIASIKKIE